MTSPERSKWTIPADFIETLKERFDLVDYIHRHYTPLRKEGSIWSGSCVFHCDSDPSFKVYPKGYQGQRYDTFYCFGCGAGSRGATGGSDAIAFLQRAEGLSFEQAVAKLAELTGTSLPGRMTDIDPIEQRCRHYERALTQSADAIAYLRSRRVSLALARQLRIGFVHPEHPAESLRFHLTFPITDAGGRVLGFAYRPINHRGSGDSRPKYRLSKGLDRDRVTFGLSAALPAIRRQGRIVLVEGPFDALALHQAGVPEAVAVMGTRIPAILQSLAGRNLRWYVWLDGDEPGQQALLAACQRLASWGESQVYPIVLPTGQDPDEWLAPGGDVQALLDQAPTALSYFTLRAVADWSARITRLQQEAWKAIEDLARTLPATPEEQAKIRSQAAKWLGDAPSAAETPARATVTSAA